MPFSLYMYHIQLILFFSF